MFQSLSLSENVREVLGFQNYMSNLQFHFPIKAILDLLMESFVQSQEINTVFGEQAHLTSNSIRNVNKRFKR